MADNPYRNLNHRGASDGTKSDEAEDPSMVNIAHFQKFDGGIEIAGGHVRKIGGEWRIFELADLRELNGDAAGSLAVT